MTTYYEEFFGRAVPDFPSRQDWALQFGINDVINDNGELARTEGSYKSNFYTYQRSVIDFETAVGALVEANEIFTQTLIDNASSTGTVVIDQQAYRSFDMETLVRNARNAFRIMSLFNPVALPGKVLDAIEVITAFQGGGMEEAVQALGKIAFTSIATAVVAGLVLGALEGASVIAAAAILGVAAGVTNYITSKAWDLAVQYLGGALTSQVVAIDTISGIYGLQGTAAADIIYGSDLSNIIMGGDGDDILIGEWNNTITGAPEANGNDIIYGNDGNDFISPGFGNNLVIGGQDNDTIDGRTNFGKYQYVTAQYSAGDDSDTYIGVSEILFKDIDPESLMFSLDGGDVVISFVNGPASDSIRLQKSTFYGELELPKLSFENGRTIDLNEVIFHVDVASANGEDAYGTRYSDYFSGGDGRDKVYGHGGGDIYNLGKGDDVLEYIAPSSRFDKFIYNYGDGSDTIKNCRSIVFQISGISPQELILQGVKDQSSDEVTLVASVGGVAALTVTSYLHLISSIPDFNFSFEFDSGEKWDRFDVLNSAGLLGGDDFLNGGEADDRIFGGGGSDLIFGGAGNDIIHGGEGDDTIKGGIDSDAIYGGAGIDTLDGGGDFDLIVGGEGDDTLIVSEGGDEYQFRNGWGQDILKTPDYVSNWGKLVFEDLDYIDMTFAITTEGIILQSVGGDSLLIEGAFNYDADLEVVFRDKAISLNEIKLLLHHPTDGDDVIHAISGQASGGAGNDTLYGTSGDDILDGGSGNDQLHGGQGNDTYYIDSAYDYIFDSGGEDTIITSIDIPYSPSIDYENFILVGNARYVVGNSIANRIIGSDISNVILANDGDDQLEGRGGDDYLYGEGGDDQLRGGLGNDTLNGGIGSDSFYFNSGDGVDIIEGGDISLGKVDRVYFGSGFTKENIIFSRHADSPRDLRISFIGSNDALYIAGFFDEPYSGGYGGGYGGFIGTVIDEIHFFNGEVLQLSEIKERVQLGDGGAIYGSINDDTLIGTAYGDSLFGDSGNDSLRGGRGNDWLYGGQGNDLLNGQLGSDYMVGGAGDDIYIIDSAFDTVVELSGEGVDTVRAYLDYGAAENVENITLVGALDISAWGNKLDNILIGNSGSNYLSGGDGDDVLDGREGADFLSGGYGNDTYIVRNSSAQIEEYFESGLDTVKSYVEYSLGDNIENLILLGNEDLSGSGNSLDNVIKGNSGSNVIAGMRGNDKLYGGLGSDTYVFSRGDGIDYVVEQHSGPGDHDSLLTAGINHDQLWFQMKGTTLEVTIVGTTDKIRVTRWNEGDEYRLESFTAADGYTLTGQAVMGLVEAMAAFSPPKLGQMEISADVRSSLESVLAVSWQA